MRPTPPTDVRPALVRAAAMLVLVLCAVIGARAQTGEQAAAPAAGGASAAAPADDGGSGQIPTQNLVTIIRKGGPVMIPIIGCSFLLVAVLFERLIMLRWGRIIPRPFVRRFLHQVREGQLDPPQALLVCEENGSPVARIFAAAVKRWGRPAVEVEQAVLDEGERTVNQLRRNLRVFNGVATVSPLLGLLGTVFGMIRTFNDIAAQGAMGRADQLANGISEALITTAAGLTIAIPALILYMYFVGRVDAMVIELDSLGQQLADIIAGDSPEKGGARRRATREAAA